MRLEKIFSTGVTERKFPPIMLVIAAMHSQQSRKSRAVSSGVEHSIHTAGVASSKLAPPTRILVWNQRLGIVRQRFETTASAAFGWKNRGIRQAIAPTPKADLWLHPSLAASGSSSGRAPTNQDPSVFELSGAASSSNALFPIWSAPSSFSKTRKLSKDDLRSSKAATARASSSTRSNAWRPNSLRKGAARCPTRLTAICGPTSIRSLRARSTKSA